MMPESRTQKSIRNARVNGLYFFISLLLSFYTRRIFLEGLGAEFMGLSSTLLSLLGFLNLTELGIGVAIACTLYKPLADEHHQQVREIISIQGYLYRKVGLVVLGLALLASLSFPWCFASEVVPLRVVYFAFFCYLSSSLLAYFVNYPAAVFHADQRGYELTTYTQLAATMKLILAAVVVMWLGNVYLYLVLELLMSAMVALLIHKRLRHVYPWLKAQTSRGSELLCLYPDLLQKTKQVFFHKLASFVQVQLGPLLIYIFTSFVTVTLFSNYMLIMTKLSGLVNAVMGSSWASVGHLVVGGDRLRMLRVYHEMLSLRFVVAGYCALMFYLLADSFINIWLGEGQFVSTGVVLLLTIMTYIGLLRDATEQFIAAHGMFHDVWATLLETGLCLLVSFTGGAFWGLFGVLLGNVVGLLVIVMIWKPYFLFSRGFHEPVRCYWFIFAKQMGIYAVAVVGCLLIHHYYPVVEVSNLLYFTVKALYLSMLFLGLYLPLQYAFDQGARDFALRLHRIIFAKLGHR